MTKHQRAQRLARIARRARYLEGPALEDPDAVAELREQRRALDQVGGHWVARSRGLLGVSNPVPFGRRKG